MKKIVMMLLILAMTVCGVIGIAACGKDPEPEQNQGQVEQDKDKDKDKEEEKPGQSQGGEGEKEDEGKGDEENENPNTKPGETNPPETPEPQNPDPENPPKDEDPKEDNKQEEDKKDEDDKKEEEPPQDEPEKDPDEGETGPTPDNPTKPDEKPEDKEPEEKPSEPEKKPEEDKKPDKENCDHNWVYKAYGSDRNARYHYQVCSKCNKRTADEKCTFGNEYEFVKETCTKDGYNLYTCTVCEISIEAQIWDKGKQLHTATGHNFGTFTYVTDSGNPGQHIKKCTNEGCDYTETEKCTLKASTETGVCTGGVKECSYCNHKVLPADANDPNGHKLEYMQTGNNQHIVRCTRTGCNFSETKDCTFETVTVEATCTTDGKETKTCECGRKIETKTPAKGHTFEKDSLTSNNDGHSGTCTTCKSEVKNEPHKYDNSNLCAFCGYDGLISESGYRYQVREPYAHTSWFEKGGKFNNKSIIILSDAPHGFQLTKIMSKAFGESKNLTTVYIPSTVTEIESGAFKGCTNLKKVYFGGSKESCTELEKTIKNDLENANIDFQYGKQSSDALQAGEQKEDTSSVATVFALPAEVGKRVYA